MSVASFAANLDEDKLYALRDALSSRRKIIQLNGLAMYRPHWKQHKFHGAAWAKYRYGRTGNRWGKSDCGSAEDIAMAIGERSWYKQPFDILDGDGHVAERHPGGEDHPMVHVGIPRSATKGLIICTDWQKAEEIFTGESQGITQGKLWKWLPKANFVRRDTDHGGHINKITIKSKWGGESTIYIDTVAGFKLNEQRGESNWYDWIHIDEPIPEAMWNSYARGLIDRNGKAWFTCTPLREPWINKFFKVTKRTLIDTSKENVFEGNRVVIVGSSLDNPHVPKAAIHEYVSGLSDDEKASRLFGVPSEQAGLVHPWFNYADHVYGDEDGNDLPVGWTEANKPPKDYTVRYHVDFHPVTPIAILFSATAPDGTVYIFDEIFESGSPDVIADMIKRRIDGYFCPQGWMDPSGFVDNNIYKSVFADDLMSYGVFVEKASKDLNRGIILTNQWLKQKGKLRFAYNLRETLFEFDNYLFQDPLKRPDKPVDKNDHMMEGLHRLILGGLDYINIELTENAEVRDSANYLLRL